MKMVIFILMLLITNILLLRSAYADVILPAVISSNMVLQRNATVSLWGWADAKEKISVRASWLKKPIQVVADRDGNWNVNVKTSNSREVQSILIEGKGSKITLENILFGEVWLCSGQSNMQQPMKGNQGQPTFGSNAAILKSTNSNIRFFTVGNVGAETPLNDFEKYESWQEAIPESVADFSAVAYFFGQQLQEVLDVPVGLIHASWGASSVQTWMSAEVLKLYQEIDSGDLDVVKKGNKAPTALFNAMINPLIPYTIKGMLWYQGEANRSEPEKYKILFPAMVKDWRARWGLGDFPIYFAQIAPFKYGNNEAFQNVDNTAFMREAQLECMELIPNSGIAILTDLGDSLVIHPPKKKEVAERLLFNALSKTYDMKGINGNSPMCDSFIIKGDKILLKFKNAETGLYSMGRLDGFEISGADKVFYPANAKIVNHRNVLVWSDHVIEPLAVRYAWKNWVIGTLYDVNMLPASSFRTDNWDNATQNRNYDIEK